MASERALSKGKLVTTLVTGSAGLLGTALKKISVGDFYFADRQDADLTSYEETLALFKRIQPRRVVHLAAKVGGVEANKKSPATFFQENMLVNLNVLGVAKDFKVEKLVSFISTCVFPESARYPLSSADLHKGAPHPSNMGYAYAKRMLDVQSRAFSQEFGSKFITLVPANMYGPGDNWNIESGHVVPSLIHKIYQAKIECKPLEIWGTGSPLREFIFSEDIARLTILALNKYQADEPLILSNSKEISIRELVEKIAELMNFEGTFLWDSSKPNGQERKPSDNSALKSFAPNFDFTDLGDGLKTTIDWFEVNYQSIIRK
jgi:GDP-L-fucose synthase